MKILGVVICILMMVVYSNVFGQELEEVFAEEGCIGCPYVALYGDCDESGYAYEVTVEATESEENDILPRKVYNCESTDYTGSYLHDIFFLINSDLAQRISSTLCSHADYYLLNKIDIIKCEEVWKKSTSKKVAVVI